MKRLWIVFVLMAASALAQPPYPSSSGAVVTYSAVNPTGSCTNGRLWWNTATDHLWICDTGAWVDTTAGGGVPSFPILAPCGSITAPSYAIGNAEMGIWCTAVDGTLLIQNRDVTPDAAGRSRLTLGVENFTLQATRSEAPTHTGAIQCFDEGTATMKCRVDVFDGAATNTTKFEPTFSTFSHPVRLVAGSASAPAYSFSAETTLGCWRSAVGEVRCTTGTFGANYGETITGTSISGFQWYDAGTLANGAYSNISGTRLVRAGVNVFHADATSVTLTKVTGGSVVEADATSTRLLFGSVTYLAVDASGVDFVDGGTKPTCNSAARGRVWLDEGGAGVADTFEACMKSAADTYAWVVIATNP